MRLRLTFWILSAFKLAKLKLQLKTEKRSLTIRTFFFALAVLGRFAFAATLTAGAGKAEIQVSPDMLPVERYIGQHDPISTRVLLLDDGNLRLALLLVDTPSIQEASIAHWKGILAKVAVVKPENILVIASHDTSAPHILFGEGRGPGLGLPVANGQPGGGNMGQPKQVSPIEAAHAKAYAQAVDTSVQTAAAKAVATLQPAQLGFGLGISHINTYRNVMTAKGWGIGYDDSGFTDPSLALIRIDSLAGKPIAWLMNYAVRSAVMEQSISTQGGKLISSDLVGSAERYLESHSGSDGATAMFLMGAAVDQSPYLMSNRFVLDKDGNSSRVDIHEAGFTLVDLLGERLGSEAVHVSADIKTSVPTVTLRMERASVAVTLQARAQGAGAADLPAAPAGQTVKVPFVVVQLGDIAFVGVAPELNASIGAKIKTDSPFPHTVVVTMVDGSAKYLPDMINYDRKTPEALGSSFARGSAERVADQILTTLKKLHSRPTN